MTKAFFDKILKNEIPGYFIVTADKNDGRCNDQVNLRFAGSRDTIVSMMTINTVRRIVPVAAIVGITVLLSGCLDALQTVSIDGSSVETTIRLTFSKSLIEGAAAMSGEAPDYSDLPELSGDDGIVDIDIPGVRVRNRSIDTATDIGAEITIAYTAGAIRNVPQDERFFLPAIQGNTVEIQLPANEDAGEMDEMTAMFFGGSRYRLLVDNGGRPVRTVTVAGDPGVATVTDVGGVSYIEIPLMIWMGSTEPLPVVLTF